MIKCLRETIIAGTNIIMEGLSLEFLDLFSNLWAFSWKELVMLVIGAILIYLAVKKEMEPTLLLPMGFGAILMNLPFVNTEAIQTLFSAGIET